MPVKEFVREFIIGKNRAELAESAFKTSLLRGYISLVLLVIGMIYWIIDGVNGIYANMPVYAIESAASVCAFYLNRHGKLLAANIIILTIANAVTFAYVTSYHNHSGIFVFFITEGLLAMALFEYRQRIWWLTFGLLPLLLFLLSVNVDLPIIERIGFTEKLTSSSFQSNVILAYVICVLTLFFVLRLNHQSETSLLQNKADLILAKEELVRSRRRYELTILGANAGMWEWNIANDVVSVSQVWKTMLGFGEHEMANEKLQSFLDLIHPEDMSTVMAAVDQHILGEKPYRTEFRMIRKDKSMIWVADSGVAVLDDQKKLVQMVGSIIDITERKEAEAKIFQQNELLAKTNSELDKFVYSTSHDLRSPLSSLLGLINIATKTTDPEEVAACLDMMTDRIRSMENFIKEIIDYSRNTRQNVRHEPVRIFPVIQEIVENLRFSEGAENIFVKYNIPSELELLTDESRLRVVMNNLVGNAIKYHDHKKDNPFIAIEAAQQGSDAYINIEDNGIGIASEHQAKIFDMFYRASEKSTGSGLSLYIVRETIEKLGGKVTVTSIPGEGTRFAIHFINSVS